MVNISKYEIFSAINDNLLQEVIRVTEDFPAPPAILSKILELTNDPTTSVDSVSNLLSSEPAVAAKILKQSNSAFYGRSRRMASIRDAVVMLGFYTVRSLVVASAAHSIYLRSNQMKQLRYRMWEHSLATAIYSRLLASKFDGLNPEEAYLGGLLHDVGKLVILERWPDHFDKLLKLKQQAEMDILCRETDLFGFSHPLVGAILIDRWLFPEQLIYPVAAHHESIMPPDLAGIVSIADKIVSYLGHNIYQVSTEGFKFFEECGFLEDQARFEEIFAEQRALFG